MSIISKSIVEAITDRIKLGFCDIPEIILEFIITFLDIETVLKSLIHINKFFSNLGYRCNNTFPVIQRRLLLLNKSPEYKSSVIKYEYDSEIFNKFFLISLKNDNNIYNFLIDLLSCSKDFYIGGSIVCILASLFNGNVIDLDNYNDSDVDIYCIGARPLSEYQNIITCLVQKYFSDIDCLITIKKFLFEINFTDKNKRKLQFILHVKPDINHHMEFSDLSITQMVLSFNNDKFIIYMTNQAKISLDTRIIFINDPISTETINRISKYQERGYVCVVPSQFGGFVGLHTNRIYSIFDDSTFVDGNKFIRRVYIDSTFKKILDIVNDNEEIDEMDESYNDYITNKISHIVLNKAVKSNDEYNINGIDFSQKVLDKREDYLRKCKEKYYGSNIIIRKFLSKSTQEDLINNSYTQLFLKLLKNNISLYDVNITYNINIQHETDRIPITIKRNIRNIRNIRNTRFVSFDDGFNFSSDDEDSYEYQIIIKEYVKILEISNKEYKLSHQNFHKYKCNERSKQKIKTFTHKVLYPFYSTMTVNNFCSLETELFFNIFTTYFLEKNYCTICESEKFSSVFLQENEKKIVVDRTLNISV